jgi:hypothetical protein
LSVSWNSKKSDELPVSNGVRQGGVLSPILFTVYIDDLLLELEKQGIGCHWNKHFVGAVCYADDITLLEPSPSVLCLMLNLIVQCRQNSTYSVHPYSQIPQFQSVYGLLLPLHLGL